MPVVDSKTLCGGSLFEIETHHDAPLLGFTQKLRQLDPALATKIKGRKKKEAGRDIVLEVVDAQTGKLRGRVLVETGLGSFEIETIRATGDVLALTDDQNRVLVYRISTGEQIGKVFGSRVAIDEAGGVVAVENEPGRVAVYDVASMTKRGEMSFPSRLVYLRFASNGTSVFALTATQVAYVVDLAAGDAADGPVSSSPD